MARVKICGFCSYANEPSALYCESCGTSVTDADIVEDIAEPAANSERKSANVENLTTRETSDAITSVALEFPWGIVSVRDRLLVGRDDESSSIGEELSLYNTVSRRHAEIVNAEGDLSIIDLGSRNGTFVNGMEVQPNTKTRLLDGDEVRFSRGLSAKVRLAQPAIAND